MKIKEKSLFIILLSIALMLTLMLGMRMTAYADFAYGSYLVTETDNSDALAKKVVKFNGIDWYIIKDESTALNAGTVTLLAKDCLGASTFGSNSTYKGSTVETWLSTYYSNNFTKVDSAVESVTPSNPEGNAAKLYLLSTSEIPRQAEYLKSSQASGAYYNAWWLRSPGDNDYRAAFVYGKYGDVYCHGSHVL